jgi:hypothetical protein
MRMMFWLMSLWTVLICVYTIPAFSGQGVTIRLTTTQVHYKLGRKLHLLATLYNDSDQNIIIKSDDEGRGELDYYINGINIAGKSLFATEFGQKYYSRGDLFTPGIRRAIVLQPGQSTWSEVAIENIYKIDAPGTYTFDVSREIDFQSGPRSVQSNLVTVNVAP